MYVSYYSRMQNSLDGNYEHMVAKEMNKIVTKPIDKSDWDMKEIRVLRTKMLILYNSIRSWRLQDNKTLSDHYKEFKIPKHSGGFRTLHAPDDELKLYQNMVLKFLTDDCKLLCHNAVHSFVKHRNCKTALELHKKRHARWFLKLDIKDFFSNCYKAQLIAYLKNIHPLSLLTEEELRSIFDICFLNNALPQGAPTSPLLSNLYLLDFDYWLTSILKDFTYTRYADDILISSPTHFIYTEVVKEVGQRLPNGLHIKQDKLRYGSCNGSNWNLGLMYNKDREVTVGYHNKHLIKNRIHNTFTNIPEKDTTEYNVWLVSVSELRGLLGYYKYIEPEYFTKLIKKYRDLGYEL